MMWSSDYPHHGNDWPYSRKVIEETMGNIPADERAHHRRQRRPDLEPRRLATARTPERPRTRASDRIALGFISSSRCVP